MTKKAGEKGTHGGRREGAGRPKGDSRIYSFRVPGALAELIDAQPNKTQFIKDSITRSLERGAERPAAEAAQRSAKRQAQEEAAQRSAKRPAQEEAAPRFAALGRAVAATEVAPVRLPYFDVRVVAGFPIPLDNDERAQDIEVLQLLCPHPESSYLIRVEGDSMIDAGILSGDIVIVDKSNRNPSPREIAVCELNGEYTLKHFVEQDGQAWLVPANDAYPRFPVTPYDAFSIWGTVTYIIHKARG